MDSPPEGTAPIDSAHLIRRVDEKLIQLLSSLAPEEWDLPTIAGSWEVRDVAAHLLDTALRKLSMARDDWFVDPVEIRSPEDVVRLVNRLNHEGVAVYRRLSPAVLIDMMKLACEQSARFHEALDPFAQAKFAVSWAGEDRSLNWFDTARELTERWHHQQQIRLATNRPGIMTRELYHPTLDCFLRGLPHAYRAIDAEEGTTVVLEITGECGGQWSLIKQPSGWVMGEPPQAHTVAAVVTIPQEIAWRVFTKGIARDDALTQSDVRGSRELGNVVFQLTAIIG
jgi:uncharacterized protein (TIGR03083 family)